MNRKKLLTSVTAVALAAVLALGGTFAWQSINQTALNESSDDVNPGGRLHDDFDGTNKDVYVENFAEEPIFARIRLSEYFEAVMNYGGEAEKVVPIIGERSESTDDETGEQVITRTGEVFKFEDRVESDGTGVTVVKAGLDNELKDGENDLYWWTWTMGSMFGNEAAYYMPTFNMNKDSLVADINGQYKEPGVITSQDYEQYTGYTAYENGATKTGTEIFDADLNSVDEVGSDFSEANLAEKQEAGNIVLYNALDEEGNAIYEENGSGIEHEAKLIGGTNGLISMEEWLALLEESENGYDSNEHGRYWVYDEDGWVYWSSPIAPDSTTGLLLDGIKMNHVMDDSWYYKLTVEAQFVTADDVGKADSTGFYGEDEAPSAEAETLLKAIGVLFPEDDADQGGGDEDEDLSSLKVLDLAGNEPVSLSANEKVRLMIDDGRAPASVTLTANGTTLTAGTDYTYSGTNGVLTLLTDAACEITVTHTETSFGTIYANGYTSSENTPQAQALALK